MSTDWNSINKQHIYQDYLFWHQKAKESQAQGDCVSAFSQRMMANSQWIASGHQPDVGHQIATQNQLVCAMKKEK